MAVIVEDETAVLTARAMKKFGQELLSKFGVTPKVLMTDKGSEYATFPRLARTWGARWLASPTGKPINEIEAKNAMVKRRLEIQRVAHGHSGNISGILGKICEDINNAPRQWREGHSPTELLTMSVAQRKDVNARSMKKRRHYSHAEAFKSRAKEARARVEPLQALSQQPWKTDLEKKCAGLSIFTFKRAPCLNSSTVPARKTTRHSLSVSIFVVNIYRPGLNVIVLVFSSK